MDEEKKMELSPENKALAEEAIKNYVEASRRVALIEEEKAIAEKAAKLIARDYGETLRRLAEEDKEDAKYRKKIVK